MKHKLILVFLLFSMELYAKDKLKIGVLAYGTVNWELNVLKHNNLDKKNGFDLEIVKLASKNASSVALQANSVDIIVTDWIWVNNQRASGKDFTFYPYSKATGTIYVDSKSAIRNLMDLKDKDLGIAGGPYDKTWLLLRAYSKSKYKQDLNDIVNPIYASAPIIYKKMLRNSFAATINFWHFNAKLKAKGKKALLEIDEVLNFLGVSNDISFVGWTFNRKKALKNEKLINSFLKASKESKDLLLNSDAEWERIKPIMGLNEANSFNSLVNGYRNGIIKDFNQKNIDDSKKIFKILKDEGGPKFVGSADKLYEKTFWKMKK